MKRSEIPPAKLEKMDKQSERYIKFAQEANLSKTTTKQYLSYFRRWMLAGYPRNETGRNRAFLDYWLKSLPSQSSRLMAIAAIQFYQRAREEEPLPVGMGITSAPVEVKKRHIIVSREMLDRVVKDMTIAQRIRFELMWGSGLRQEEAWNVVMEDIDLEEMTVVVRNGKGGKKRKSILSTECADLVREHGLPPIHMSYRRYTGLLTERGAPFKSHDLRHSCGTRWAADGMKIEQVSKMLGHLGTKVTVDTYIHLDYRTVADKANNAKR